jgi:hypothetical protein
MTLDLPDFRQIFSFHADSGVEISAEAALAAVRRS